MKKITIFLCSFVLIVLTIPSCSKSSPATTYPIQGLWIGTYVSTVNGNTPYEIDFSIKPDGTVIYHSEGAGNVNFYALGTWTINGTNFSYSVVVAGNTPPGGDMQSGTAIYSSGKGTLTGNIADATTGGTATFLLTKVN
jgi:hypothetical protein